jgi:hypothetical protein
MTNYKFDELKRINRKKITCVKELFIYSLTNANNSSILVIEVSF